MRHEGSGVRPWNLISLKKRQDHDFGEVRKLKSPMVFVDNGFFSGITSQGLTSRPVWLLLSSPPRNLAVFPYDKLCDGQDGCQVLISV